MGGFHNSPKYAWDEGYLALAQTLIGERDAAIQHVFNSAGIILGIIGIALISFYWYKNRT